MLLYILLLFVGIEVIVFVSDCFLKVLYICKLIYNFFLFVNIKIKFIIIMRVISYL